MDFRSNYPSRSGDNYRSVRSYVGTIDTGTITIDTMLAIFAERRKIYSDHGSYSDQFLECINCKSERVFVYDSKILKVDEREIRFELSFEREDGSPKDFKEKKIITVDRRKLNGVMYKL